MSSTAIPVVAHRKRTTALPRVVIALLALLAALFVAGLARPAAAHAWTPDVNGCGSADGLSGYLVPNKPLGFDFTASCNGHDWCYGDGLDKSYCDTQFLNNMKAVCNGNWVCNGLADTYYYAVSAKGQSAYDQSTQDRLDKLVNDLNACNGDSACEQNTANSWDLDSLINDIVACQGDAVCEQQAADRYPDIDPGPLDDGGYGADEDPYSDDPYYSSDPYDDDPYCDFGGDLQAEYDAGC